jgi:hypothetical protein
MVSNQSYSYHYNSSSPYDVNPSSLSDVSLSEDENIRRSQYPQVRGEELVMSFLEDSQSGYNSPKPALKDREVLDLDLGSYDEEERWFKSELQLDVNSRPACGHGNYRSTCSY